MIHRRTIITLFTLIFVAFSTKADKSVRCNRTCGTDKGNHKDVPYPFGFSSGCEIRLNCTDGDIRIGEYKVQNITGDNILINIPADCNRRIQKTKQLFSPNYALTWQNDLMLKDCASPLDSCRIPRTTAKAQFESHTCSSRSDNTSCYSPADDRLDYATYEKLEQTGCRFLFTSIVAYESNNLDKNSTVSLQFQTAELKWLLNGPCRCSMHADCTSVGLPDSKPRFRCRCEDGIEGDGFADGHGCRRRSSKGLSQLGFKVIIGVSVSVSTIIILIVTIYCLERKGILSVNVMVSWKKKRLEDQNVEAFIRQYGSHAPKQYRYSDINKMTNAFKEKLGEGGYGTVYKGKLSDGCLVAVKILSDTKGNSEEFINEVASICRTSHVNVVALLGFCFERNRRALVYEFVAKGSLDKFIYNGESLEWKTLYQIAVGIARGLEYLHRGCSTRIVHFDIKPQNILLDEDFCPKISDFGLSKLCQRKQSIISMLGARGTAGYIAPEVFSRAFGGVSHKSDVYSYGMLVLEITGARENPGVVQTSEVYFPQWIYEHLEHGKDLRLVRVTTREEEEIARKMILVGLWCIQTHPSDRPSIGKVLEMLEGSVESLQIPPKPSILSPIRLQTSACDSLSSTMDLEVAMSASNPLSFQIPSKPLLFSTARSGQSTSSKTLA